MSNTSRSQSLYQGRVLDLYEDTIEIEGRQTVSLEIIRHPGGAAALALDSDCRVCLIRQFRHAAGGWIWEIPAGRRDHQEDPMATAQRELREEVGLVATQWQKLGAIWSTPGFCTEVIHVYLARDLQQQQHEREADEFIEVHWKTADEFIALAQESPVMDSKTLAAAFYLQRYLASEP